MPMINSTILGMGAGGLLGKGYGTEALTKFTSRFVNASLGLNNAVDTTRRRLEEGNGVGVSALNGSLHGAISMIVEGLDMGQTVGFFTGTNSAFTNQLGYSLFKNASPTKILRNLGSAGWAEAKEELIEGLADWAVDAGQNVAIDFINSVNGTTIQNINEDRVDPVEMAQQMAMAYAGAFLMGSKQAVRDTQIYINSKNKYNSVLKAKEYFESVLNSNVASVEEKTLAQECINRINDDIEPYKNRPANELTDSVELPSDVVGEVGTYEEAMNNLANAIRPDIQQETSTALDTLYQAQQLQNNFNTALAERGLNISTEAYMNMDARSKQGVRVIGDFLNLIDTPYAFDESLERGDNGKNENGVILINPNQSETFNIDTLAEISDPKEMAKFIANDADAMYESSPANSDLITTATHELNHSLEGAKA